MTSGSVHKDNRWKQLSPDDAKAVYEEAAKAAYYFSDWRYKLLTYFLALAGALGAATEWLAQHDRGLWTAVPFLAGYVVSLMLGWMDYRNVLLLRISHAVAASVEDRWGVGVEEEGHWRYEDRQATSAFYSALAELQPFVKTQTWTMRQRWSSYTVTMTAWFLVSAIAFSIGAGLIASANSIERALIAGGMTFGVFFFFWATRGFPSRHWIGR